MERDEPWEGRMVSGNTLDEKAGICCSVENVDLALDRTDPVVIDEERYRGVGEFLAFREKECSLGVQYRLGEDHAGLKLTQQQGLATAGAQRLEC
jgi:hypothetical protein